MERRTDRSGRVTTTPWRRCLARPVAADATWRGTGARLVEAIDAERRRVERDLHDGAQQRLVWLGLTLRSALAQAASRPDPALEAVLTRALAELKASLAELRDLARGIYPAILTQRGLATAVTSLADRAPLPVTVAVEPGRHPVAIDCGAQSPYQPAR